LGGWRRLVIGDIACLWSIAFGLFEPVGVFKIVMIIFFVFNAITVKTVSVVIESFVFLCFVDCLAVVALVFGNKAGTRAVSTIGAPAAHLGHLLTNLMSPKPFILQVFLIF
jgi:hypothetical protein